MVLPLTTQENVYLSIKTTLGDDAFILNQFKGEETFSDLFWIETELYIAHTTHAQSRDIDLKELLQTAATISVRFGSKTRHISGMVTEMSQGPTVSIADPHDKTHERTYFYMTLRPRLWFATLRQTCRIFQNQSTIEIIKTILGEHDVLFDDRTSQAGQETRIYCVQYNETDFHFISRLMECEGIYYFFTHTADGHTMVLGDNSKPFSKNPDVETVPNSLNASHPSPHFPALFNLRVYSSLVSSLYTTTDFDFEKPKATLLVTSKGTGSHKEVYHYPGGHRTHAEGTKIADNRLTALESPQAHCIADTNIPLLVVGSTFTLTNCPRKTENQKEFILQNITHDAKKTKDEQGFESSLYANHIVFFHKDQVYLPLTKTARPAIYGTQTAIVTGKEGEEIWTDQYGRVLVKFHWDLSDRQNDQTSCWIRVAQGWTGKNWGMLFTPRVGQEVVVSFLEGNPDRPLITGCVYNGDNPPPYLPDTPTKSTLMTNSSKGGEGFNELRFEDLKDQEQIFLHAQKDFDTEVFNGNRTCTLFNHAGKGGDDTLTIKKGNRTMTLSEGHEVVQLDQGNRTITLAKGDLSTEVTGNIKTKVTGNYDLDVGGNLTLKVTGNITITADGNCDIKVTQNLTEKAMQITSQAQTSFSFKAATITGEAEASLSLKGTATATLESSALTTVKAPAVMLGG